MTLPRRDHGTCFGPGIWTLGALALAAGCKNPDVQSRTFFERRIAPILDENCVSGTANNLCHAESEQKPGEALGNLDLSSFDAIHRRPELLTAYGSYPEPVMLLKSVKPDEVSLQYAGVTYESEIFHAGGGILSRNSEAFVELQQWLRDGATEDGVAPDAETSTGSGPCVSALRPDVEPFLGQATGPVFDSYLSNVEPIIQSRCAFGSCHGSSQSDFYVTCGDTPQQQQHNFIVAWSFVADPSDRSELLLRPLAATSGGVNHSGGSIWESTSEDEFGRLRDWAAEAGPLTLDDESAELRYFADHVMPAMLRRGCAMPQCHSPQGFNDFRLRAGSRGFFSPLALRRNYETTLTEFVSLDSPDPNESRVIKKNIIRDRGGIEHRAGITLLDALGGDDGGNPDVCPAGEDEQPSSYCTMIEWIRRERAAAVTDGRVTALAEGDAAEIIYVDRPADADRAIDFATYRGGARLMRVPMTMGVRGAMTPAGDPVEIDLTPCGITGDADVRGPEVSWDGAEIAFAARVGEGDGLDIYRYALDGSSCTQLTSDGGTSSDGVPVHNLDPYFVPPDPDNNPAGAMVFASTRAGAAGRAHVSPRYKLPATNIWRMGLDGSGLEQMTFLSGSELAPAIMQNGQITMTTEKATPELYQLSGRRINWDLTDYHPLLAQRDTIGFSQATDIREAHDRDFLMILSNADARFGAGALVAFNRSIGPFEFDREGEPGYLGAVEFLDPLARDAGRGPSTGAYRHPYPAPDGSVLVSYTGGNLDVRDAGAAVDFDLVLFDPTTGTRTLVAGGAGFQVDGIVVHARSQRKVFVNVPELVFGGTYVAEAAAANEAWAHFPDLPMLATLLTANRRAGRNLDELAEGDTIAVYRSELPPSGATDDGSTFQSLSLLGTAPLAEDGSAFIRAPAGVPVVLELRRGDQPLLTMTEEHQFGAGELTSLGVSRDFFDGVCGGCHGSITGAELDVVVDPDALTGASVSVSRPELSSTPSGL